MYYDVLLVKSIASGYFVHVGEGGGGRVEGGGWRRGKGGTRASGGTLPKLEACSETASFQAIQSYQI